jgi:hypothetical protein
VNRITLFSIVWLLLSPSFIQAQPERWQQRVNYEMTIDMDARNHQYNGVQKLTYYNNSPDTLHRIFYHLYFNAFQPGSMMDVRARTMAGGNNRFGDRISKLKPEETGWIKVANLLQNGKKTTFETNETILEVTLAEPILPNSSTVLEMTWERPGALQIRRSGRNNREGVDYSMAQWYPKLCEYDYQGWHANPYIAQRVLRRLGRF